MVFFYVGLFIKNRFYARIPLKEMCHFESAKNKKKQQQQRLDQQFELNRAGKKRDGFCCCIYSVIIGHDKWQTTMLHQSEFVISSFRTIRGVYVHMKYIVLHTAHCQSGVEYICIVTQC